MNVLPLQCNAWSFAWEMFLAHIPIKTTAYMTEVTDGLKPGIMWCRQRITPVGDGGKSEQT